MRPLRISVWLPALILCWPPCLAAEIDVRVVGPPQTVFNWAVDRCADDHIPNAPARAFRDASGAVHLFAAHHINWALVGDRLDTVRPNCRVVFQGAQNDDPSAFDDRIWLAAFHTDDGRTVHALGHAEYHGHRRPDRCPAGTYMACWRNAVVQLVSNDFGYTFRRADDEPPPLVAALPYPYDGGLGRHSGYFSPSNIVTHEGYSYVFVSAVGLGAQRDGQCLLRTDRLNDPSRWRAWDGRDFAVRFIAPYLDPASAPERHACAPVAPERLTTTVRSVTRHIPSGMFVALLLDSRRVAGGAERLAGVFAATSPDLRQWSEPRLVWARPVAHRFACDDTEAISHPSLLDPDSPSRNFETADDTAYLYFTRFHLAGCKRSMNRDLVVHPARLRCVSR